MSSVSKLFKLQNGGCSHLADSETSVAGEVPPLRGARDEQVRRQSDHGEEEGGRGEFSKNHFYRTRVRSLVMLVTNSLTD